LSHEICGWKKRQSDVKLTEICAAVVNDSCYARVLSVWLWSGAGCSSQMCQYERMQILGIRHPLPPTTTDTESAAGLSYHVIATCVHLVVCLSTGTWIHFLLEFDSNSSNKQNLGL